MDGLGGGVWAGEGSHLPLWVGSLPWTTSWMGRESQHNSWSPSHLRSHGLAWPLDQTSERKFSTSGKAWWWTAEVEWRLEPDSAAFRDGTACSWWVNRVDCGMGRPLRHTFWSLSPVHSPGTQTTEVRLNGSPESWAKSAYSVVGIWHNTIPPDITIHLLNQAQVVEDTKKIKT